MQNGILLDACVFVDAAMPFREHHADAKALLLAIDNCKVPCFIPSHAYFEMTVAALIHFKREPENLLNAPEEQFAILKPTIQTIDLTNEYVQKLMGQLTSSPIPDMKSQDLIYFCIARDRGFVIATQDKKLRNIARRGGIEAYQPNELHGLLTHCQ